MIHIPDRLFATWSAVPPTDPLTLPLSLHLTLAPPLPPQWSDEPCAAHLTQRDGYQASTQVQLKDQLYQQIINYFDKGKVRRTVLPLLGSLTIYRDAGAVVTSPIGWPILRSPTSGLAFTVSGVVSSLHSLFKHEDSIFGYVGGAGGAQ